MIEFSSRESNSKHTPTKAQPHSVEEGHPHHHTHMWEGCIPNHPPGCWRGVGGRQRRIILAEKWEPVWGCEERSSDQICDDSAMWSRISATVLQQCKSFCPKLGLPIRGSYWVPSYIGALDQVRGAPGSLRYHRLSPHIPYKLLAKRSVNFKNTSWSEQFIYKVQVEWSLSSQHSRKYAVSISFVSDLLQNDSFRNGNKGFHSKSEVIQCSSMKI
jgi:hypothetical protein